MRTTFLAGIASRARAFAARDLDGALQLWNEVLVLNPADTVAKGNVDTIREHQRVEGLKIQIKQALDQSEYARASSLIADLQRPTQASLPCPPTVLERPARKRFLPPWLAILAIAALSAAFFLGLWVSRRSAPDVSKSDAVSTKPVEPAPTEPVNPPVDLESHFTKAAQFHEQGMYDAAIAEYDAILKADPGNERGKAGRAKSVKAKETEANAQK